MKILEVSSPTDCVTLQGTYEEFDKIQKHMFDSGNRFGALQVRLIIDARQLEFYDIEFVGILATMSCVSLCGLYGSD